MKKNEVGTIVIQTAIDIHRDLGPALLESVYEIMMAYELNARGLPTKRQVPIPIACASLRLCAS